MNIHEYQGKEVLAKYGVSVPQGKVAFTTAEAVAIAEELGGPVYVVKSQIHAGGRGAGRFKSNPDGKGGVRVVKSVDEVKESAEEMLGQMNGAILARGMELHKRLLKSGQNNMADQVAKSMAQLVQMHDEMSASLLQTGDAPKKDNAEEKIGQEMRSEKEKLAEWASDLDKNVEDREKKFHDRQAAIRKDEDAESLLQVDPEPEQAEQEAPEPKDDDKATEMSQSAQKDSADGASDGFEFSALPDSSFAQARGAFENLRTGK